MAAYRGYEKRGYNYYRRQVAAAIAATAAATAAAAAYGECEESARTVFSNFPSLFLSSEPEDHHLYVPANPMTPRIISLHY